MNRHLQPGLIRRRPLLRASCALLLIAMVLPQLSLASMGLLNAPILNPLPNDRALIQNSVQGIVQGPTGFLWVATLGGLHRFDGLDMVLVNDLGTPENKFNILQVTAVAVAPNGDIWAGGAMSELARINAGDNAINHFRSFSSQFDFAKETVIQEIKIQPSGVVWIKNSVALVKFDPITQEFERLTINFPADWGREDAFRVEPLDDGHLIIHNQTDIGILNLADNNVTHLKDSLGNALPIGLVTHCRRLNDGYLWTCGPGGKIGKILAGPTGYQLKLWQAPTESRFTGLAMDLDGNIWLTVDRWQVVRWHPVTNTLSEVSVGLKNRMTPEMHPLRALFCDRSGVMWLGTESFGLLYADPSSARFVSMQQQSAMARGFRDPYLWDIKEDEYGLIVAGRGEFGRLSLETGEYKRIIDDSFQPDAEQNFNLNAVLPMGDRKFLVAFQLLGLGFYDEDTRRFEVLEIYGKAGEPRPKMGPPAGLEREKSGKVWAFFMDGTWLLSADGTRREPIPGRLEAALQDYRVRAWAEHKNGMLAFGTERHGLIQYDPRTDKIATWEHNENPNSLPHNGIRSLCYDSEGNLWVGT